MAPLVLPSPVHDQPKARIEALLRERQLDRTLTTATAARLGQAAMAPFGLATLDDRLGGGLPRGQLSELVGPASSGRTSLAWTWLGAATRRGECVALVDTFDRCDPASAAACGLELSRLLWVRGQALSKLGGAIDPAWLPGARGVEGPGTLLERTLDRALKAWNLVLQSGVCTAVVLDMAEVPLAGLRRIPHTTWLRMQRVLDGGDTACLLLAPTLTTRSAGGISMTLGPTGQGMGAAADARGAARWAGTHDRARRLAGLSIDVRLSSPRRTATGGVSMTTTWRRMEEEIDF